MKELLLLICLFMAIDVSSQEAVLTPITEWIPEIGSINTIAKKGSQLYIGSSNGLYVQKGESFERVMDRVIDVHSISVAPGNQYWVGSNDGNMFHYRNDGVSQVSFSDSVVNSNENIITIKKSNDVIWLGTNKGGIVKYNTANKKSERLKSFYQGPINSIFQEEGRAYLIGRDNGLFYSKKKNYNKWLEYQNIKKTTEILELSGNMWMIGKDNFGESILLSTKDILFDWDRHPIACLKDNQNKVAFNDLALGGKGKFWIGTDKGLIKYNIKGGACETYFNDQVNGMPIVKKVEEINDSTLWVLSDGNVLYQLLLKKKVEEEITEQGLEIKKDLTRLTDINCNDTLLLSQLRFQPSTNKFIDASSASDQLQILVAYLKQNPENSIELFGHTDNLSSNKEYLKNLSQDRVDRVQSFLTKKGIKKSRIKTLSYGGTKAIIKDKKTESRDANRRVEVFIKCKYGTK